MSTLGVETGRPTARATGLAVGKDDFTVLLADGRGIVVPYGLSVERGWKHSPRFPTRRALDVVVSQ